MGRKRRKKAPRRVRPTLPTVFECPACGAPRIRIQINDESESAQVSCGKCGITHQVSDVRESIDEIVDIYSKFVDLYWAANN